MGSMTGAILVTMLAVLCAAGTFAAVLVAHRPDEGWVTWVRESFRAWRSDELTWTDAVDPDDAGGLGTLYLMSEPGNAYTTPEELGGPLATRLRDLQAGTSDLRNRGEGHPSEAHA